MKEFLVIFCAIIVNVKSHCSCGCASPCYPPPLPVCRPPPCPAPVPAYPRPLPPCPRPAPVVEILDYPITYEVVTPCATPLPTCNCPSIPSLPVSPQIIPSISSPVLPSVNIGLSPCLGGCGCGCGCGGVDPIGLINPFLPPASPISAIAPTVSSLYPPICPCNCGCKYLRQIPIPPPFI